SDASVPDRLRVPRTSIRSRKRVPRTPPPVTTREVARRPSETRTERVFLNHPTPVPVWPRSLWPHAQPCLTKHGGGAIDPLKPSPQGVIVLHRALRRSQLGTAANIQTRPRGNSACAARLGQVGCAPP